MATNRYFVMDAPPDAVEVRPIGDHTVQSVREPEGGVVTREAWLKDGKLDRADGPAWLQRSPEFGTVVREEWLKDGTVGRDKGPAVIERDARTATTTKEEYWSKGELDRTHGPAIRGYIGGIVSREEWWKNGQLHRDGGPASFTVDPATRVMTSEELLAPL